MSLHVLMLNFSPLLISWAGEINSSKSYAVKACDGQAELLSFGHTHDK